MKIVKLLLLRIAQLGACTTLVACTTTLDVKPFTGGPQSGLVYALPLTQFDITLNRKILSCDGSTMRIGYSYDIKPLVVEDPDNTFVMDPTSLSHFYNTATSKVVFHPGTRVIKSFNASVVDDVSVALSTIVSAAAGIAQVRINPAAGARTNRTLLCSEENGIPEKVQMATTQTGIVSSLGKQVAAQSLKVAQLVVEQSKILPGEDPSLNLKVAAAVKLLKDLESLLGKEQDSLRTKLKAISFSQQLRWPMSGGDDDLKRNEPIRMPKPELEKWVGLLDETQYEEGSKIIDVYVSLEALSKNARTDPRQPFRAEGKGLFYRSPVEGDLVFARNSTSGKEVMHRHRATIAQLGFVNKLAIEAGPFESVEFEAIFDVSGALSTAGYKETASAASSVASLVENAASEFSSVAQLRANSEQAELSAELLKLQTQVMIAENTTLLNPPAQEGPTESEEETALLNAETTLLQAKIAQLQAMQQLLELQGN